MHLRLNSPRGCRFVMVGLVLGLALALSVRKWVWMPTLIRGESMAPTLRSGSLIGINKLAYLFQPPQRGDIVALWTGRELMIKRVVGLPGERVALHDGVLFVNGRLLREPYACSLGFWRNIAEGQIPVNSFVVMGDNRSETVIAVIGQWRIVGRCH